MSEMLDRCWRAACLAGGDDPDREGKGVTLDAYVNMTRAVLSALMEPTPEMIEAAVAADEWLFDGEASLVWKTMLAAAMQDGDGD
jgi:hypothetical protein